MNLHLVAGCLRRVAGCSRRVGVRGTGVLLVPVLLAACSTAAAPLPDDVPSSATDAAGETSGLAGEDVADSARDLSGTLVVFAAASLEGVFTELGEQLEAANPDLTVTFSFAASSTLAQQVNEGAPADVLATANVSTMEQAAERAPEPIVFGGNELVIATPAGNSADVTGLDAFADPELVTAVCAAEVPCGTAAAQVFEAAGITPHVSTYTENVTAALTLAVNDEVDAALVYATDAAGVAGEVESIAFPESSEAVTWDPIAVLTDSANADAAQAFVDLVLSPLGQAALAAAGFSAP